MNWQILVVFIVVLIAWWGWKKMSFVQPGAARQHLQQGAKVIDVRNPDEFASRHLPSAVNIPLGELARRISQDVPDKNTVLLLHCEGGVRSGMAKRQLEGMGYTKVFNLGSYGRAERIVRESGL